MARRVSKRAWEGYTRRLEAQRAAAYDDAYEWVVRNVPSRGRLDMKRLRLMMVEAANHHGKSTAALAATWFDQMARAEGADAMKAVPVNDTAKTRVKRMAICSNKALPKLEAGDVEGFARAIASAVAADVKRQATNTVMLNAQKNGAEYAWIPGGAETCAFCIALAANGWQPAAKATAMGEHADHIHDNCECEFAIRFNESTEYGAYDAQKYADIYGDADGRSSQDKINSIRRELYAENRDKINEQHRERYAAMNGGG
ncbi:MAG: hypothetical protein IJ087_10120 [Eggerthellaceae bacterium]|nr:hypothetical protein [Eggerthellaceae bacterium]